jgi:nucleotidyltransferase/DNA polymerase involved in DNA repair
MQAHGESNATVAGGQSLIAELRDVPKAALQTIFGQGLGRRIWSSARGLLETNPNAQAARLGNTGEANGLVVADGEIVAGMVEYVSRRAGEALRKSGRQAKAIGLAVAYADGTSSLERTRLARPTNDATELAEAAIALFRRTAGRAAVAVAAVDLRVTSILMEPVYQHANDLTYAMMSVAST